MIPVISAIMVMLGFANGMVFTTLFDQCEIGRLKGLLAKALDAKFEAEKKVDDLRLEVAEARLEKAKLLVKLNSIVCEYGDLPPPDGPLERSRVCSESESEEDFNCPTSPDVQQSKE